MKKASLTKRLKDAEARIKTQTELIDKLHAQSNMAYSSHQETKMVLTTARTALVLVKSLGDVLSGIAALGGP